MKKIIKELEKTIIKSAFCFLLSAFCFQQAKAQPWLELLPQEKTMEELTLKHYQQAFNTYWEAFHVDKGYIYVNGKKQKAGGWKQFKRWEYKMEGQVDDPEIGIFPNKTGMQVVSKHKKTNPEVYANTPREANWSSLGPFSSTGGYAGIGRLNCIAFHPTELNTWWVGAASGGLWKTANNGGNSWECFTDDNGALGVSDIIILPDYETSQTIYIATGDRDGGDSNSIGVLKSTDGGATWKETGLVYTINQNRRVNRLLLDPNDINTIIAATSVGVYKTTDGGATWNTQLTNLNFIDMEFKPGDFSTLYGSRGSGIWRTTDSGENWEQVLVLSPSQQRTEIAVTPANSNVVYAVVSNNSSGLYGIYKSTDGGANFDMTFSGSTLNLLGWSAYGTDGGGQGWYDLCIAASPTDADVVLVGGVNTWRSTNGGYNWQCINHWWGEAGIVAVHADKHALVYRNDGILFEGNDGGVYISPNNGTTWTDKTNGMQISQLYRLGCSATDPGDIMTGLQDNGSKLFSGNNWRDVIGGDGMECLIDYTNVNIQYGTIYYGVIERTMNHWNNSIGINPRDDGAWVTPFIIHPTNPQILYAGYSDLYKTENRGNTWTQISNVNTGNKLKNIAICDENSDVIYMADDSRIWKTIDGGQNWTQLSTPSGSITYLCVKNDDPNTIWYTRGGYNASRVFKSMDGGVNWVNISEGLPNIPMYSIVSNKLEGHAEQLYVGSEVGVYYKDGNEDWVAFNTGLPNVKIGEIEIYYNAQNPDECRLRAATYGRGLWESPIYILTTPVAGTITGAHQLCEMEIVHLFLMGYAGTIQWQESLNGTDWNDIAGATASSYKTEPLNESKFFRAKVTLGTSVFSEIHFVEVFSIPQTPVISKIENRLTSSANEGNQWYNQDGLIPGAIEKNFTPTENGTYFTIVTIAICASEPSNSIMVDDLSIGGNAIKEGNFKIFPNPVNEQLIINNEQFLINRVVLVDVTGKEAIDIQHIFGNEVFIDVARIPAGVYQARIETDNGIFTSKVVKQ